MTEDIRPEAIPEEGTTSFKPGARLKKAREMQGLSFDQVVAELRLSRRILAGMEADVYTDLPEPAFVRGYMRRYAQLVKLAPDDIAARFDQAYAADTATPPVDARPRNPIQLMGDLARPRLRTGKLLSWLSFAAVLVLGAGFFLTRQAATPVADSVLAVPADRALAEGVPVESVATDSVSSVAVSVPSAEAVVASSAASTAAPQVLPSPSGPARLPAPVGVPVPSPRQEPVPPALLRPAAAAASVATDTLLIALTAESWIKVVDADGRELAAGNYPAGKPVALSGKAPFSVNLGNAPAASLGINGRNVDLRPHTRGAVATLTVNR
ncbi:MAG: DUF4115 domain-containing protein [Moraxellaceae bacterium]|nr:DUF4115 domain-containing protein [Moraxellaceae bacterium]